MDLTREEKMDFLNHRILSYRSWLDLEKEDLSNLISEGSIKVAEIEADIVNRQNVINALEDTLKVLTIGS
jgi:ribosome-binding protein aMBF1 (putative translation factor)